MYYKQIYDNENKDSQIQQAARRWRSLSAEQHHVKSEANEKISTMIVLQTKHADCRITFKFYPIRL